MPPTSPPHTVALLLGFLASVAAAYGSSSSSSAIEADRASLIDFKASVTSDPSNFLSDWDPYRISHCSWSGVACDPLSGRVRSLSFSGAAVSGTLSPSLANLTSLEVLNLRGNNFSGQIPGFIGGGGLPRLRSLDLSRNSFSGWIPDLLIGAAPSLESVDLSRNVLSGPIRIGRVCRSLVHLRLSRNFLTGRIPPEIGGCANLETVKLDGNVLEGRIPPEAGRLAGLRVLDVSRNSLTGRIPGELGRCLRLSVLVLSDPTDESSEFNAFVGGVPSEVAAIPNLEALWAPRANIDGGIPDGWGSSGACGLRVLNLARNYLSGPVPETLGLCRNLSVLDLSSNGVDGPFKLTFPYAVHLNVSRNSFSGALPGLTVPDDHGFNSSNTNYYSYLLRLARFDAPSEFAFDEDPSVIHDFSWNGFSGPVPSVSLGPNATSYALLLNNNRLNGSLKPSHFAACENLGSFAVDLSTNRLTGDIPPRSVLECSRLKSFQAAYNRFEGPLPPGIAASKSMVHIDLRGNRFSGNLPARLGELKNLRWALFGGNELTGEIPPQLGEARSLIVLDLSRNMLSGGIPLSLGNARDLEVVLLDRNRFSGEIPSTFTTLPNLTQLDVSYNNLSGYIPPLAHSIDCNLFKGNTFLQPCPTQDSIPPAGLPLPLDVNGLGGGKGRFKSVVIASVVSASAVVLVLLVLVLLLIRRRRRLVRVATIRRKAVVTFTTEVPAELSYENVVRATGNFSVRNLIGMGGFGATYKAELSPGFLVAVKRLSMGRFQGLQQFDAEIRTLGRIRHKNLVTLVGYHTGDASDTFLIYNYLSGGNLEMFIKSGKNGQWPVVHKIALNVAQALAYLHYSCEPRIVHRDIKPSNILLDDDLNAYLSDFGLARLLEVSETHATTDVAGTFGYVAPEYATTCRVSDKADVYSFGVVLLELMSGKRSLDPSFSEYGNGFNIVSWAKLLIKEGRQSEAFSPPLWAGSPQDGLVGMLRLASACTMESVTGRPTMKQVVERLKRLKSY